jgi:hypothetical protein
MNRRVRQIGPTPMVAEGLFEFWWKGDTLYARNNAVRDSYLFAWSFKSGLLPGSPCAYLSALPDDLKRGIAAAFIAAPTKDKAAFDRLLTFPRRWCSSGRRARTVRRHPGDRGLRHRRLR